MIQTIFIQRSLSFCLGYTFSFSLFARICHFVYEKPECLLAASDKGKPPGFYWHLNQFLLSTYFKAACSTYSILCLLSLHYIFIHFMHIAYFFIEQSIFHFKCHFPTTFVATNYTKLLQMRPSHRLWSFCVFLSSSVIFYLRSITFKLHTVVQPEGGPDILGFWACAWFTCFAIHPCLMMFAEYVTLYFFSMILYLNYSFQIL